MKSAPLRFDTRAVRTPAAALAAAAALATLAAVLPGCGEQKAVVTVELTPSSDPLFDPYQPALGLQKVRVVIDGNDQYDDATVDLDAAALATRTVSFADYPTGLTTRIRVFGYDQFASLVAYGVAGAVKVDGDTSVRIAFRPNLAFVTHLPNPKQRRPASALYVFDVGSSTFLTKLALPGTSPVGRGVSTRGGEAVLVTYEDAGKGYLGVLDTADGQWSTIELARTQDLALAAPGAKVGVVAGGGSVALVDLDAKTVLKDFEVGGTAVDGAISADGKRAIFAMGDVSPSALVVDLTDACTSTLEQQRCLRALDVVPTASGIALAGDGVTAFITSRTERTVFAYDLSKLRGFPLDSGFAAPVGAAAYADEAQAVIGLESVVGASTPHVLTYVVPSRAGFPAAGSVPMLYQPSDIAADGSGRRLFAISAGTSTTTAGITTIETSVSTLGRVTVEGSTGLYPTDPDDTFVYRDLTFHQRFQPFRVGVLNGR